MTVSLSPGRAKVTAATALGSRASRSRGRMEGILWVTREGVGEDNGGDPILSVQRKGCLSPTAQQPRNSATELSTTSIFRIIFTGKGDI